HPGVPALKRKLGRRFEGAWDSEMTTLTYIVLWPLLTALGLAFVPRNYRVIMRAAAIGATGLSALLALKLFLQFSSAPVDYAGYRFVGTLPWLGSEALGMACRFGVDGINVGLVFM